MASESLTSIISVLCLDVCAGVWNDFVSIRHICFDRCCTWSDLEADEAGPPSQSGEREPLIPKPVTVQPVPSATIQDPVVAARGIHTPA